MENHESFVAKGAVDPGRNGGSCERGYRLDKEYERMFELSREIAENTVELQMDMEEYLALKREYVKELRDMASEWSKEKNSQR